MEIEPRVLKGFRDFLPPTESRRKRSVATLERTFESFGFEPIDTPVLEYTEVLLGKGGGETDKQVYRFEDHGGRDVAMRFDLTVPFARFMAQHRGEVGLPFKRYHIAKVWRGENTQRGRYREFTQCDFDIVGSTALSADLEIIVMIDAAFEALGVAGRRIHLSHRGVFNRFLDHHGVREHSEEVLRTVDKLRKQGAEATHAQLAGLVGGETAAKVLAMIGATGTHEEIIAALEELTGGAVPETEHLRALVAALGEAGIAERVVLDPSITRGLDYYTGVVFETFLDRIESIGSVCSGGRYDDLVTLYSNEQMPGVGASIGLDRLVAALEELEGAGAVAPSAADAIVLMQDERLVGHYHRIARAVRGAGLRCEVFPDAVKLGKQFAHAERRGIPFAIICGEAEQAAGTVNLRHLATRRNSDGIPIERAIESIARSLGEAGSFHRTTGSAAP